jgi:pyruvate dehydrogenase E1 component
MIVDEGMQEMIERQRDVFYYLTVTNENYAQPSLPATVSADTVREGVLKGMYPLDRASLDTAQVQLLGSGAILGEVQAAARMLKDDWNIDASVWSVTSFTELHRDGVAAERAERFCDDAQDAVPYVTSALAASRGPVIAATDYVRAVPELIRAHVPRRYVTLGTDGFGRSDTRAALRAFFEVDRASIAIAALKALADEGTLARDIVRQAIDRYERGDAGSATPWEK